MSTNALYNISSFANVSSDYDEVDYNILYRNFFTVDDIALYFAKYKERIVSDYVTGGDHWEQCLKSDRCGKWSEEGGRATCMGCIMTKRFNPRGTCNTGEVFTLKSGELEGESYKIERVSEDESDWVLYLCCLDIFLGSQNILYFFICNSSFVHVLRQYDYGNGTFDVLLSNSYTSFASENGLRYLNPEVIEAVLYQVEKNLETLTLYDFRMRPLSVLDLCFSSRVFEDEHASYSVTVYIVPPKESGMGPLSGLESSDFDDFFDNLMKDPVFERSYKMIEEVVEI